MDTYVDSMFWLLQIGLQKALKYKKVWKAVKNEDNITSWVYFCES
jgi:hypothetical protein